MQASRRVTSINYQCGYDESAWWRMEQPRLVMNYSNVGSIMPLTRMIKSEDIHMNINTIRIQGMSTDAQLQHMREIKAFAHKHGTKFTMDLDDIPEKLTGARLALIDLMDYVTVPTQAMADFYQKHTKQKNFIVIPTLASKMWFGRYYNTVLLNKNYTDNEAKKRVLYTSDQFISQQALDNDFAGVVDDMIANFEAYQWVFLGKVPTKLQPYVESGEVEQTPIYSIYDMPNTIQNLRINAIIKPMADTIQNQCSSNIRFLESVYLGIPFIGKDIGAYSNSNITFKKDDDMIKKLNSVLKTKESFGAAFKEAKASSDGLWMDDTLGTLAQMYFK
jgi:hypothetical protein